LSSTTRTRSGAGIRRSLAEKLRDAVRSLRERLAERGILSAPDAHEDSFAAAARAALQGTIPLRHNGYTVHIESVKAAYRRYARVYDAVFGPVLQPGRKALLQALGCRSGDRVLEVGVGTGLSLPMYPADVSVTGIDVSRDMLERARERVAKRGLRNVDALLEMNAESMSFPDASFDKVVAMYVVSVVERPARLIDELHRVCRPDGEIFLVNHVRSENRVIGALEKSLARFADTLGFHPDFELAQMTCDAGQVTEVSRINFFWKVLRLKNGVAHRRAASAQPIVARS
jgi:phosphatidylethanolamine/phosphatidyl-N-methylethanolamine N-methyltransferase